MLFLSKQDANIKKNEELGQNKYPYFKLLEAEETEENGEKKIDWKQAKEVAAFWKAKSGKGYSGKWSTPRPEVKKEDDKINFD